MSDTLIAPDSYRAMVRKLIYTPSLDVVTVDRLVRLVAHIETDRNIPMATVSRVWYEESLRRKMDTSGVLA